MSQRTLMETSGSRFFDFADPRAEDIHFEDIARGLSHTCRFGGHVRYPYSVAEHACLVRRLVQEAGHPDLALAALHHDSHEAFLGDLPTPLKVALGDGYREMVDAIDAAVAEWLRIDPAEFHAQPVVAADQLALRMEAAVLKDSQGITGAWPWRELPDIPDDWYPGLTPEQARRDFSLAHLAEGGP